MPVSDTRLPCTLFFRTVSLQSQTYAIVLFASLSPPQLWNHPPVFQKPWWEREVSEITCSYILQDNWVLGLGDSLCSESYWQKQVLIPEPSTWVSKSDQIENCSKEEKPDWEEIQVVKWDQPQSSLIWKVFLCPLFCLSLCQVKEEQVTQMPLFMYSHSYSHHLVSTWSSVLLPLPPVCRQLNENIPAFMTPLLLYHLSPSWGFSLSLFLFTDSFRCWRWRRQDWTPWYILGMCEVCMQSRCLTFSCSKCVDHTCHSRSHFTHLQICGGARRGG